MKVNNYTYEDSQKLKKYSIDNNIKDDENTLIQISTTLSTKKEIIELLGNIKKIFKKAHIVGTTSYSNILNDNIISKTILNFSSFLETKINTFLIKQNYSHTMDKLLNGNEKLIFLYSTSRNINIEMELETFKNIHINKDLKITGGMASSTDLIEGPTYVFDRNDILECGIVLATLNNSNLKIDISVLSNWDRIGKSLKITKSVNNRLYEINNLPAYEVLEKYLGNTFAKNLPYSGIEFPIIFDEDNISRTILSIEEDKSIYFAGNLKIGANIHIGYGNKNTILEESYNTINNIKNRSYQHEALYSFSCISRLMFLGKDIQEELTLLKSFENNFGFFTFGEIYTDEDNNYKLLNQTMIMLEISEEVIEVETDNKLLLSKPNINEHEVYSLDVLKNIIKRSNQETEYYVKEVNKKSNKLKKIVKTDILTGINNRYSFNKTIKKMIKKEEEFFLAIIDINKFKKYNDEFGHNVGDKILTVFSDLLKNIISAKKDKIFRFGGDEFTILFKTDNELYVKNIFNKLFKALEKTAIKENNVTLGISISCGLSAYKKDALNKKNIINTADLAMLEAKKISEHISNQLVVYTKNILDKKMEEFQLVKDLTDAIKNKDLTVVLQPQFNSLSNKIVGAEALVRWNNNGVNIYPDTFIPLAEQNNLISDIDFLVLEKSIIELKNLIDNYDYDGTLSVNTSVKTLLSKNYINKLKYFIKKYKIPDNQLEIELTESLFINNYEEVIDIMEKIRTLNCKIALDDFGTGYSSISYLNELPITKLKIDKAFIDGMPQSAKKQKIVKGIIMLTKVLRVEVIAEGVETEEELNLLKINKCFNIQGYFYSRPIEFEAFRKLYIEKNSPMSENLFIN